MAISRLHYARLITALGFCCAAGQQASLSVEWQQGTTLPGTCEVGQFYFKTNATAGQNIYACTVVNTWTVQGGGGGGDVTGPGSSTGDNIALFNGATGKIIKDGGKGLPSGAVVGTTDTQTLSAKTLTAPVINSPTGITKAGVGLGNVDNTADAVKSVASAAAWTTPRAVNGVALNGTADITVTANLPANPSPCTTGQYTTDIDAAGSLTCAQVAYSQVSGTPALAPIATSGSAADLTAGTVPTARLGSGTADASTFLRGDNTWATPGGGADPWTYLVLGSTFSTTSGTAVDVTGMAFTPSINTRYEFECRLMLRTATATVGPRPGWAWPSAGVTDGTVDIVAPNSATAAASAYGNFNAAVAAASTGIPNTTQSYQGTVRGILSQGASVTGTARLQLTSETAGTSVEVRAGSFCKYRTY